jgi:hypothetical protein
VLGLDSTFGPAAATDFVPNSPGLTTLADEDDPTTVQEHATQWIASRERIGHLV